MFRYFRFSNQRSFKDEQTFVPVLPNKGGVTLIYGHNATGKTNLLTIIHFIIFMVRNFHIREESIKLGLLCPPFALSEITDPLVTTEICLGEDKTYIYGFVFDLETRTVNSEWLLEGHEKQKAQTIFSRKGNDFIFGKDYSDIFGFSQGDIDQKVLALEKFAQTKNSVAQFVFESIAKLTVFGDHNPQANFKNAMKVYGENPDYLKQATKVIEDLELDVPAFEFLQKEVDLQDIPADVYKSLSQQADFQQEGEKKFFEVKPVSYHDFYGQDGKRLGTKTFSLPETESTGTLSIVNFLALVFSVQQTGSIAFVDNFGSDWHPETSLKLANFLKKSKLGQFVLLTHETLLLEPSHKWPKDQVWVINKNKQGESELKSLEKVKSSNLQADYLAAKFKEE